MRIGINPEKEKARKLSYKVHRVIVPVYIPEENHDYFENAVNVFQKCVQSLLQTIDPEKTAITIINNSCKKEVKDFIQELLDQQQIDKHVHYSENKGKVYAVLQEARSSFEEFITIADGDVFFFNHWENAAFRLFETFENAGVVGLSPNPNTTFYCNNSLLTSKVLAIKSGSIVDVKDLELFEEGINRKDFFVTDKVNWKEEQYYLKRNNVTAILGAGHFASTYRSSVLRKIPFKRPVFVFPGGELGFIDKPIDILGYYRLSLPKAYVYHMGNTVPEWLDLMQLKNEKLVENSFKNNRFIIVIPYKIKEYLARIIRKIVFKK